MIVTYVLDPINGTCPKQTRLLITSRLGMTVKRPLKKLLQRCVSRNDLSIVLTITLIYPELLRTLFCPTQTSLQPTTLTHRAGRQQTDAQSLRKALDDDQVRKAIVWESALISSWTNRA